MSTVLDSEGVDTSLSDIASYDSSDITTEDSTDGTSPSGNVTWGTLAQAATNITGLVAGAVTGKPVTVTTTGPGGVRTTVGPTTSQTLAQNPSLLIGIGVVLFALALLLFHK